MIGMYKALFFAGRETGLSKEEIIAYRQKYGAEFRKLGFTHAALDLRGYRTGSMNEGMTGLDFIHPLI